jgi:hypothetical protein
MGRLQAMVLGRLGWSPLPSSKGVCSILPIARHLRAGEVFRVLTPARGSLLKPAAGQGRVPCSPAVGLGEDRHTSPGSLFLATTYIFLRCNPMLL